jgi:hypothetical protein
MLALLCCACVTHIRPAVSGNPPPTAPLSHCQHFKLAPVRVSGEAAHEQAAIDKVEFRGTLS